MMQVRLGHSPELVQGEQVENEVDEENDGVTSSHEPVEGGEHDLGGDGVNHLSNYQLARDRVRREIREPVRMGNYQTFLFFHIKI